MNYYQKSKQLLKSGARSLNNTLEKKQVKRVKRFVIIIFAMLIILDVIFVLPYTKFPTISRVVLMSSPKYLFVIWLWGIATSNIFFPRRITHTFSMKITGLIVLIVITVPLFYVGNMVLDQSDQLLCSTINTDSVTMFTDIICYNDLGQKVDCAKDTFLCSSVRVDINTGTKAIILLAGMLFGYFFWPQFERKVDRVDNVSE